MKLKGILLLLSMALVSMTAWGIPLTEKSSTIDNGEDKVEISATSSKAMTKAEVKAMKKANRQQKKLERKQEMFKKVIAKKMDKYGAIDFSDPVKKWMWFWILGWAAGLLLWIIGAAAFTGGVFSGGVGAGGVLIGLLGSLCWLFGSVCLVVWLIKMAA